MIPERVEVKLVGAAHHHAVQLHVLLGEAHLARLHRELQVLERVQRPLEQIAELDALGMVWEPVEERWLRGIAAALALEPEAVERLLNRAERLGRVARVADNRFFLPETLEQLAEIGLEAVELEGPEAVEVRVVRAVEVRRPRRQEAEPGQGGRRGPSAAAAPAVEPLLLPVPGSLDVKPVQVFGGHGLVQLRQALRRSWRIGQRRPGTKGRIPGGGAERKVSV